MTATYNWDLVSLADASAPSPDCPFAVLILNHPIRGVPIRTLWQRSSFRVAADGGAGRLPLPPATDPLYPPLLDAVVGDLDSLTNDARASWQLQNPPPAFVLEADQVNTDFAKAASYIRDRAPGLDIVAVGGLGGRVDQALSVLHHLYLLQPGDGYQSGRVMLVGDGSMTILLKTGKHAIRVATENRPERVMHVGIVPMKEPSIISTAGLQWDVDGWSTQVGGQVSTSNRVARGKTVVEVETTRDVLFTVQMFDEHP